MSICNITKKLSLFLLPRRPLFPLCTPEAIELCAVLCAGGWLALRTADGLID
jgi:hypothetical protein